jgi:hypothetical protein
MIILYIFVHYISDFSLSEWVKDNGLDINDLSESTIQFLLVVNMESVPIFLKAKGEVIYLIAIFHLEEC